MLLHEVISEIRDLGREPSGKAVHDIFNLLANNRAQFEKRLGAEEFAGVFRAFRDLTDRSPGQYHHAMFRDEYQRAFNLLMFYLGKIL
jgi:hypothetical protein